MKSPQFRSLLSGHRIFLLTLAFATLVRLWIAFNTYGTNDAAMWDSSAQRIRAGDWLRIYDGLVRVYGPDQSFLHFQIFNHPPLMVLFLHILGGFHSLTNIPPSLSLRIMDAFADAGTSVLFYKLLLRRNPAFPIARMAIMVLSPVWVAISAFHSNSDPLMIFLLMLSVHLAESSRHYGLASSAFALSTGIKIVPLLLIPAFIVSLPTHRSRLQFIGIISGFWLLSVTPWLLTDLSPLIKNMIGYGSISGHWGVTMITSGDFPGAQPLRLIYQTHAKAVIIFAVLATTYYMRKLPHPPSLVFQFGLIFHELLTLTPGFGIQYLLWLYPWIGLSSTSLFLALTTSMSLFLVAVYTLWSGGFPWYYANSIATGTWGGGISGLGLGSWVCVVLSLFHWIRNAGMPTYPIGEHRNHP